MTFDPVPWMVGGGALHSVNIARTLAHAAFGGRQGVVNPRDLEVREFLTPTNKVRIYPGTCAIANQASSALGEMYVGRNPTQDEVSIASTTSAGTRSDLIVVRVENPFEAGESWSAPSNPTVGPYIFPRVISNVPASTTTAEQLGLGYSMVALARIDLPVSTATVTQAMIKDLRQLASVYSQRELNVASPTVTQTLTASAYTNWPSVANMVVDTPDWATHVSLRAVVSGTSFGLSGQPSNTWGGIRVAYIGSSATRYTEATGFNVSAAGGLDRATLMAGGTRVPVVAGSRGKPATIRVEASKSGGNTSLNADTQTMISLEAEFTRFPEANL